jgi:hypothetical protein
MISFMLEMGLHPCSHHGLQREMDAVVRSGTLSTFEDIPNLPTVRAVAKETLRWRPVTAGGLHIS